MKYNLSLLILFNSVLLYSSNYSPAKCVEYKSSDLGFNVELLSSPAAQNSTWKAQDGDRPNIVKKFIKPIGSNLVCCIIMVKKAENILSDEDITDGVIY